MIIIHTLFIALIGLCLGSFASLIAYRWPRGLPWVAARSACPACGHALGAKDLVPLFSWLATRGKCRYCQTGIPVRYPVLEIICSGFCLGVYALVGWHWTLIPALAAVPFIVALVVMRLWPVVDQAR